MACRDDWTACSVDALTVASTRALIAAASMFGVDDDVGGCSKNADSEVGEGVGVLLRRERSRACGDG